RVVRLRDRQLLLRHGVGRRLRRARPDLLPRRLRVNRSALVVARGILRATMRRLQRLTGALTFALILIGCTARPTEPPPDQRISVTQPGESVTFAVIGDFGEAGQPEADVAALVHSWAPEFVATVGDNNYLDGSAATIDENIGQYYHDFIAPYSG